MQMMRAALLVLVSGATATAAAAAPRASEVSWGKPGVSLEDYAIDAGLCAYEAMKLDVSDTREARRLVAASRRLENVEAAWGTPAAASSALEHRRIVEAVRPERLFEAIEEMQQEVLDSCLAERGYQRFRLTREQRQALRRLEEGSTERRAYLHRLAADPEVLSRQRIETAPPLPPQG